LLKLSDLAALPDFDLGPISVSPARRIVSGPSGEAHLEPLVMQVFLLLLDLRGSVVSRTELFDQVWGGVMVGDDSLNRVIARVRRIAAETAPGLFEIETIPRTGYRMTGAILDAAPPPSSEADGGLSRRHVAAGVLTVAATAAGGLGLWSIRSREDRLFDGYMDRGEQALDFGDPGSDPAKYFQRAVSLRPDNAKAQSLFAYSRALRADGAEPGGSDPVLQGAERAVDVAMALDPNGPDARLAEILIQRGVLDFAATEDRLRKLLERAPENIRVMRNLWNLLQCVGRSRDALALVERAIAVKPLAAANNYPKAQLLWILGRNAEADRVIDKAMQFWPTHRFVRFARFSIFAFTDRPRAALAMLDNKRLTPQGFSPDAISLWRVSLSALDQRSPTLIAAARRANQEAASRNLQLSSQAVLTLSALGEIDAAFEVAEALFAVRRPSESPQPPDRQPVKSTAWRFAPWLFTPPTEPLRTDPRFDVLCEGIGLTDYWRARGLRPDYQAKVA
jgi:DNA-binding winged helix-turn-helix (wHTH) protein/tetratricopeptide (TPR) repeat protein